MADLHSLCTIADFKPGDHLCCLYETEKEHRALLAPFLRQGLEHGEKVLYIVDSVLERSGEGAHTAETVLDYLREDPSTGSGRGLDVEPCLASGQFGIVPFDDALMPDGVFDPDGAIALLRAETERALAEGYLALRVTDEMTWALRGLPGAKRLIEYEAKLNEFFPGSKCIGLCQYDRRRFAPAVLLDVLTTHAIAVVGGRIYDNPYYVPPTDLFGADLPAATLRHWLENLATQKTAEKALRESARQLESQEQFITRVMESIPSSLVVIDRSLRVVSANRNFLEKARRNKQTTLGGKIEKVFPLVLLKYTRLGERIREVFHTGRPIEGGKVAYRAPGLPTRIYYYRLIPLQKDGTVGNVMLLMDDITEPEQLQEEIRRAERHMASVVDCANDLVISMDPQGNIMTWNRAAEAISGLRSEPVKGQPLLSLCAAAQRPAMAELLQGLVRGEGVQHTEANLLTADGQEVPIAWSCSPMRDDVGELVGIVAVGRDLTERQRLEAQLLHSAKMASLGGMAGGIAHEVRNPLGIISAGAQLLMERPDDARLRSECAEKIYIASQRTSLIIENLLKFARPQSEQMREMDLHTVIEETLALLAHQMALRQVTLRKEFEPGLPRVYGNPNLLLQVFTNLVLNAQNAMPEGGTLTVTSRATQAGEVEIRFTDTGRGIPQEHLSKIFDPFFTTMPVGEGTGLGLSISYSIIQQHKGSIVVNSKMDQGSDFIVRLPGLSGGP